MKTNFLWGHLGKEPIVDKLMSRERMARLMRAWRRSKTKGRKDFDFRLVSRKPGERIYSVSIAAYKDAPEIVIIMDAR